MTGFNEESQMPEKAAGGDESATVTDHESGPASEAAPSAQSTDRFGLQAQGKGYLLRKYNIVESARGEPYFTPIDSMLATFVADAEAALAEARARVRGDEDLQAKVAVIAGPAAAYLEALLEHAGDDRAWFARSLAIWPLTDQVGFQLYKACSGEADLLDYASYIVRTDASVESAEDLESHEGYGKRQFWTDLAYDELGVIDAVIAEADPDSLSYNLQAIIRKGYQSAAQMDTRNHLRGVTGKAPITGDMVPDELRTSILASRRAASQAA